MTEHERARMAPDTALQVRLAATTKEQLDAVSLLLSDRVLGQEVASLIQGLETIEGLLLATVRGRPVGASWLVCRPGPAALLVPPATCPPASPEVGQRLIEAAVSLGADRGYKRIQSFVVVETPADRPVFEQAGFRCCGEIHYMAGDARQAQFPPSTADLGWTSYTAADHDRLLRIVERTYIDSLDCPRAEQDVTAAGALESYRGMGESGGRLWSILRCGDADVGCLLLGDYPSYRQLELLYVGVVPEYRGRRIGELASRWALGRAAELGRDRVVLAVDTENRPAYNMYVRAGYEVTETRRVWLRSILQNEGTDPCGG